MRACTTERRCACPWRGPTRALQISNYRLPVAVRRGNGRADTTFDRPHSGSLSRSAFVRPYSGAARTCDMVAVHRLRCLICAQSITALGDITGRPLETIFTQETVERCTRAPGKTPNCTYVYHERRVSSSVSNRRQGLLEVSEVCIKRQATIRVFRTTARNVFEERSLIPFADI